MTNELKHINLKVLQFELEFDYYAMRSITLDRAYGINIERWCIRIGTQQALSKTPDADGFYHFHIESLPSDRDDEYYEEYRWPTADAALAFWKVNRPRIIATSAEKQAHYRKQKA